MSNKCGHCGKPLVVCSKRPAKYCSGRCRQAAYRKRKAAKMGQPPAWLAKETRWVRAAGKRPVTINGAAASTTNQSTWSPLPAVLGSKAGDGYGVMLGHGLACIDLDHVLHPDGTVHPVARRILDEFPDAYVERSCSGEGLHIFGMAAPTPGRRIGVVEVYTRARFIRLTCDVYRPGRWDTPLDVGRVVRLADEN